MMNKYEFKYVITIKALKATPWYLKVGSGIVLANKYIM